MSGLYDDTVLVERFVTSASAGNITQPFIAPTSLEVIGLVATVGTAPGGSSTVTVNVSASPTSQLANVSAYNLWTAANVPTITGTSKNSFTTNVSTTVVENIPYALNYPLPGPSGTVGYSTAQSSSQTTETPVTAPPTIAKYQMGALVAPDNTYTDYNGFVIGASTIHSGDILTFVVGGTTGSAANLEIVLFCQKR